MPRNNLLKPLLCLALALLLVSCSSTKTQYSKIQSANHNDRIRYLVMHFTAINYEDSLAALTLPDRVSAHYLIPENNDPTYLKSELEIQQLVEESDRAWHAGVSYWQGKSGLNDQSIGIELVHQAPCLQDETLYQSNIGLNSFAVDNSVCMYPEFDEQQMQLLIKLSKDILSRHPEITPTRIIGHSDIAPARRVDPGPRFPWYRLYQEGIGAWYENDTLLKYFSHFNDKPISIALLQRALNRYGYQILETGQLDPQTINVLTVFQMHFRPWAVTGRPNNHTAAALFALLERYMPNRLASLMKRHEREYQASLFSDEPVNNGQLNQVLKSNSRDGLSYRAKFRGQDDKGSLSLSTDIAVYFDLYINEQLVQANVKLAPEETLLIDIGNNTRSGTNYLRLENVSDSNAIISSAINFPTLTDSKSQPSYDFSAVDEIIKQDVSNGFPGAVLAVVKNGQLIKHQAYGYAQKYSATGEPLPNPEPMNVTTLFDLASNTKMYATNYALMRLSSEGRLDINKPIINYLPDYKGSGREQRLVKDLLQHTAGYAPSTAFYSSEKTGASGLFSQNAERTKQLLVTKVPFKTARNIKSVYSDNDYLLLGILVERITGKPLDEYVEDEIYAPLGLNTTMYNPLQKDIDRKLIAATELAGNTRAGNVDFENIRRDVIHGEVHDEKAYYSMAGVAGHAGLFSSAEEVAKLAMVILNRGGYDDTQIFSASVLDQYLKPSGKDITTGMGWRRAGNGERTRQFGPYASPYAIGHTGWTGTVTVIDPFHDLVIVLLTNKKHSPIVKTEQSLAFSGDQFETGKYGSVVSAIYEAVVNIKPSM